MEKKPSGFIYIITYVLKVMGADNYGVHELKFDWVILHL